MSPRHVLGLVSVALALATAAAEAQEPAWDEADYLARYGVAQGCDAVAQARKTEETLRLPFERLRPGEQEIRLRYVESGWPLGIAAGDSDRPVRLSEQPAREFRSLPRFQGPRQWFGVLELGPALEGRNRFPVVLDGDPQDLSGARLFVSRDGSGDFSQAVPLSNRASSPLAAKGFATILVLPVSYRGDREPQRHPTIRWAFFNQKDSWLRHYAVSHWRAGLELPSGRRLWAVVYDIGEHADHSAGRLALVDASYSNLELFSRVDGGSTEWHVRGDKEWRTRSFLTPGESLNTPEEMVTLRSLTDMGNSAVVEVWRR